MFHRRRPRRRDPRRVAGRSAGSCSSPPPRDIRLQRLAAALQLPVSAAAILDGKDARKRVAERLDRWRTLADDWIDNDGTHAAYLIRLDRDLLEDPDWLTRYIALTAQQALVDAVVSAIKAERGRCLAEGRESGLTLDKIAEAVGLGTRQRVQQLIQAGEKAVPHSDRTEGFTAVRD